MANRNFPNGKSIYVPHVKPVIIDATFTVASSNANGLGVTNVKAPYISNVFMHTSAPLAGSGNPNPPSGYIQVRLMDNYSNYLGHYASEISILSGTPVTTTVAGTMYAITALGTATLAQWNAVGFPAGFTPAVNASFVATASAAIGGSAAVQAITANGTGISHIEAVGDPNQTLANSAQPSNGGGIINFAIFGAAGSGVVTPADGTKISLVLYFNDSKVPVNAATA